MRSDASLATGCEVVPTSSWFTRTALLGQRRLARGSEPERILLGLPPPEVTFPCAQVAFVGPKRARFAQLVTGEDNYRVNWSTHKVRIRKCFDEFALM